LNTSLRRSSIPHPTARYQTKTIPTWLSTISLAAALSILALFLFNHPKTVHATPNELGYAETQYPFIVGAKIDSCTLCHTAVGTYLFNPYGQAYSDQLGSPAEDFKAIENLDSDGDGYSNLQEIKAGTSPGDPLDHPISSGSHQVVFLPLVEISIR
jgi:hypothetical protein